MSGEAAKGYANGGEGAMAMALCVCEYRNQSVRKAMRQFPDDGLVVVVVVAEDHCLHGLVLMRMRSGTQ